MENKFRVKYLDAQDIEELGFEVLTVEEIKMTTPGETWYKLKGIEGDKFTYMLIHSPFINKVMINKYYNGPQDVLTLFSGEILNKSELKWILTRLGIL